MERRLFIGAATGAVGAVALAGCTGGDEGETDESGVDEGERPVELLGIVVYADPKEEEKYEEVVGAEMNRTIENLPSIQSSLFGGLNEEVDMVTTDTTQIPAFYANNLVQEVPTDAIDQWSEDNIAPNIISPRETFDHLGAQADRIADIIWKDPDAKEELTLVPTSMGYDGMSSNPKFIEPGSISTFSALFDDQYEGDTLFQSIPTIGGLETLLHLVDNDMLDADKGELNNPTEDQIDAIVDFLVKEKEAGQFRRTWDSGGTAVNLLANEEAHISDLWQTLCFAVRREGTPLELATMGIDSDIQGYRHFFGSVMPTSPGASNRNNVDEVHAFINDVKYSAWYSSFVQAQNAYAVPHYPNTDLVREGSDETGDGMGPEFYDWAYEGEKTYQAVDEPFLFDPTEYDWSMKEGEPDSDGVEYEADSIDKRNERVGVFQIFPDNGEYLTERWQEVSST